MHRPAAGSHRRALRVESRRTIRVIQDGVLLATPFLDLSSIVAIGDESGFTSFAFHPQYQTNRKVYVQYNTLNPTGGVFTWIVEYQASESSPLVADPTPIKTVLKLARENDVHVTGWMEFGPLNGMLYVALGDSGGPHNAQDLTNNLLGKILRINPDGDAYPANPDRNYSIPSDNPLVGVVGDDEIWTMGLRNPWQTSIDRLTGGLWIPDVGWSSYEEINVHPTDDTSVRNFAWGCMEGSECQPALTTCVCGASSLSLPVYDYSHAQGCAVIGGRLYRGCDIPALHGAYVFADWCQLGRIYYLRVDGERVTEAHHPDPVMTVSLSGITAFGEDNRGELYVGNFGGSVYKLVPVTPALDGNGNGIADACEADLDSDGMVGGLDLAILLGQWGRCPSQIGLGNCTADLNDDGAVNGFDLALLLAVWS